LLEILSPDWATTAEDWILQPSLNDSIVFGSEVLATFPAASDEPISKNEQKKTRKLLTNASSRIRMCMVQAALAVEWNNSQLRFETSDLIHRKQIRK
jgi:hypothetical protein